MNDEVLSRIYNIPADTLWAAVKRALPTVTGVILKSADDGQRRAEFTTSMSWTSWGEEMIAVVDAPTSDIARLVVTGHARSAFLTTQWGEHMHQNQFGRDLIDAIERCCGEL